MAEAIRPPAGGTVFLLGVGNPVKRDDSVGLYLASQLRRSLGASPAKGVRIPAVSFHPELAISRMNLAAQRLIVLDAVEAGLPAGSVVFASLSDSKYGFFATHNIPLRMHPSVVGRESNVYVLGVQPDDVGVGEGLSPVVQGAAEEVLARVGSAVRGGAG